MLETGITDGVARYASGNGTATLTFNYFVKSGDYSSDLDYVSWGSLVLSGGTIRDTAGNAARLTLLPPGTPGSLAANKALVLDTTAPQVPTGLTAMAGPGGVALQWTAPTDNVGVTGYRIYRFGVLAGSSTGASFQEAGLLANTIYRYRVSALDAAGNESVRSVPLDVTTRPANPGEILRLSLEEGSGTVAGDGSGQGNNGTLLRGPVWTTGASGGALAFDGRDDAVFVANSSSIATLTTQVSVAAWVYRAGAQANWAAVISRQVGSSPFNLEHWWLGFSGKGQYRWFVNTTAGYSSTALGGTAPVGQWVHLVGTYDGAMVRLYVNGVQQFATPETGTFPADTTGLMIGASVNDEAQTAVEAFNGRIDQVGVYNVALTASQVQSLYAGTLP
jgi:chitodextrinase